MDFHGMKRKDLQSLCKTHGIPANLKTTEMANRLASLLEKETEEIVTETKDNNVVVKKVRFSPENEVFEFTRSVKKRRQRKVGESGVGVRRSTRIASKVVTVGESSEIELNTISETEKEEEDRRVLELIDLEQFEDSDVSKGLSGNDLGGFNFGKVKRRSTQLIAKGSKGLVKDNVKEVSMDVEVQETRNYEDRAAESVRRRTRRFVSEVDVQTNAQDRRKSMRLTASAANASTGVETKESKEESKTRQSKKSVAVISGKGELVKSKTKEPLIDCEVQATEKCPSMKVEKVPRRSKRLGNDVNLLMDKRSLVDGNVKAVDHDDLEVEKSGHELLVVAPKGAEQLKTTSAIDCEDKKLPRRSKRTAVDKMRGQATANSLKRRDGAADDNVKKLNVNDEMQVRARFTRNSSRNGLCKAPVEVEGSLVEKKRDAAHVKSSKVVARRMKRGRRAEPEIETETTFTQTNVTPEKLLEEYPQTEQQEASCVIVEARDFTKKSKTMRQQCFKDMAEGMNEDSPSSSETKAIESVSRTENVLDSTLEKLAESSQKTNTQELNSELVEGEREEKLEHNTDLVAMTEEQNEEVVPRSALVNNHVSPGSVQLAATSPEAQLVMPTGHMLVKDTASTVIANTKDQTLTCTLNSDLLQDNPLALADESPSTETIATIPTITSENVTVKVSGDISLVRDRELVDREHVEKNEQETVLMAVTSEKEEATMMSVSIVECSKVKTSANNRSAGDFLSEESTPPPTSVQPAMNDLETNLSISSGHNLVKDIVSAPRTEHGSGATLAKVEVTLQKSAEIHSNKDDEKGSLEKDLQSEISHGNLFDEHSIAEEEMVISKVGCMRVVPCENETPQKLSNAYTQLEPQEARECLTEKEIKVASKAVDESTVFTTVERNLLSMEQLSGEKICLTQSVTHHNGVKKSERRISSNALNLSGWLSTDFASPSPKEENVSECLEEEELKAARNSLDDSAVFTTRERNLMVMEQVSENGMICAAQSVTHLNDEAVESHAIVLTTPEKVLLIGEFELGEVDKECGILNTEDSEQKEAVKSAEKAAPKFHEKSANIPERQSIPEEFEAAKSEKLRFDYGHFSSAEKNLLLVTDEEMKKGDDISISSGHNLVKDIVSTPRTELKGYGSVANLAKVEVTLQNSAEIHLHKEDRKGSLENDLQAENSYENFFDEHSNAEEEMEISKVACMSVVSGENLTQAWASNVEATGYSKKMDQEFEKGKPQGRAEDSFSTSETKVIESTPKLSGNISLVRNKQELSSELLEKETEEKLEQDTVMMVVTEDKDIASIVVPEEDIITKEERLISISRSDLKERSFLAKIAETKERHLMVMEQLIQNGKMCTAQSVPHHNKEGTVVVTTPEKVLLMGDSELDVAEKEDDHTATEFPDESNKEMKRGDNIIVKSHVVSSDVTAVESQSFLGDSGQDEAVESHAIVFTTPEKILLLEDSVLDEVEKEDDHTTTEFPNESDVFEATDRSFMLEGSRKNETRKEREGENHDEANMMSPVSLSNAGGFKGDGMENNEEKMTVEFPCNSSTCTSPDRLVLLGNLVSDGAGDSGGSQGINRVDKSGLILTSLEKQLFYGDAEQKEAVKSEEKSVAEFHDEPTFPFLEDSEINEAVQSEDNEVLELQVDCDIFASEEKRLLLKTDEEMKKGDKVIDKSHVVSDDVTAAESQCVLGDSEPGEAEDEYRENMDVESLSESNISTKLESHLLAGGSCRSTDIQNRLNDTLEVLATKGNNVADELMEANVTNNTQIACDGNLQLDLSEKTCVLARTEDEHLGFELEALEDEVTSPMATTFEETISPTLDECTTQNNSNEEVAAGEEVVRRETTPALKDEATDPIATAFEESVSVTRDEFTVQNSTNKQDEQVIRRELLSVYGTQLKLNGNDMNENAPNSKVVHNLNLTAPRMTKRKPLQDLRNN